MRFTVLCLVLFSSLFIACGGAPEKICRGGGAAGSHSGAFFVPFSIDFSLENEEIAGFGAQPRRIPALGIAHNLQNRCLLLESI